MDKCQVKRCRRASVLEYMEFDVCWIHWDRHCDEESRFDLKKEFQIKNICHESNIDICFGVGGVGNSISDQPFLGEFKFEKSTAI